jgi:DNA-binding winged helix-turn-helix (wHTH) protein/Tol biopolymer transport system component
VNNFLSSSFSFSDFIVDPQANLLIKKTSEKRLEPKVISLLILLASNDNKVISKQQIRDSLWPNVIVGDETIARTIFALRQALTDDAKNPTYIETIPKKGYRFLVKASLVSQSPIQEKQTKFPPKNIASFIFLALILIAATYIGLSKDSVTNFSSIDKVLPITNERGSQNDFSINQITNEIMYVNNDGITKALYVRALSGKGVSRKVSQDEGEVYSPLWLDQHTILYIQKKQNQYQIVRKYKHQETEVLYQSINVIHELALNKHSKNELSFTEHSPELRQVSVKTLNFINGKITDLMDTYPEIPKGAYNILYSGDGETLYIVSLMEEVELISALELKTASITIISEPFDIIDDISLGNNDEILVSGISSDIKGLWSISTKEKKHKLVLPAFSGQSIVNAEMDQQKNIYYANYEVRKNLGIVSISENSFDPLPQLNSHGSQQDGVFSADEKHVYFVSNRSGYFELWAYEIKSGLNKQITHLETSYIGRPLISSTNKYVAIVYRKQNLKLAVFNTVTKKIVSEKEITGILHPLAWSKDDNFIFLSEHIRQVNLYQYDRETLTPSLIQESAGLAVKTSDDEKRIIFVDYLHQGLVEKNLVSGQLTQLATPIANLNALMPGELKINEQSVFFIKKKNNNVSIVQLPLNPQSEIITPVTNIDLAENVNISDISQDGSKLVYSNNGNPQGRIMKIQLSSE